MKHLILGYVTNGAMPMMTREQAKALTHVNLAFGVIKDGLLDMHKMTNMGLLPQYRQWNPELKIVLSVGGWTAGGFSNMAMTEAGRRAFAVSCREAVEKYGLDGIDIDWEYPCSADAGIDADPADRENFTHLLQALRDELGKGKILSIAAGAGEYFVLDTEIPKIAAILDYVQIMTYDMRSGFTHQAGHHASLYANGKDTSTRNTADIMAMFHQAGIPKEKLVVGAAFYCRVWQNVPNVGNGMLQEAETAGLGGPGYGELTPEYLEKNAFRQYWDEDAKAAYLWNGKDFVSYESPEAIRLKCEYVKEQGFLGIMYWEHGCDPAGGLLFVMQKTLNP